MEEVAFGIIPLKIDRACWKVLLIQHRQGHWTFPKGRPDKAENPKQTAERELDEETGLKIIEYLKKSPVIERYHFQRNHAFVSKKAVYYLALVEGELSLQKEEVLAAKWLTLEMARSVITFAEGKTLCNQIKKRLRE